MRDLVRMPLDGGGTILFEAPPESASGPVRVGRARDAVRDLPQSLQHALAPVGNTARAVLAQLRQAGPDEVEVEFGVDLSAEAGAIITRAETAVHLKVRVLWRRDGQTDAADA